MHGILKEDLYQLSTSFVLGAERGRVYSLQEMRDAVDDLTNKFVEISKGTKFVLIHRQQSGWVGDTKPPYSKKATGLISTWESEDGKVFGKDLSWGHRYLEQYEEKGERINIHGEEFSLVICHSPSFVNSTFYRKIGILMGNKKRVRCLNDKNYPAWITTEENYNFTDNDEQLRFNKFLDTVKSFT